MHPYNNSIQYIKLIQLRLPAISMPDQTSSPLSMCLYMLQVIASAFFFSSYILKFLVQIVDVTLVFSIKMCLQILAPANLTFSTYLQFLHYKKNYNTYLQVQRNNNPRTWIIIIDSRNWYFRPYNCPVLSRTVAVFKCSQWPTGLSSLYWRLLFA